MNITLNQKDIVKALSLYIGSQGINMTGKELSVVFTSGRKSNGITAALSIEDAKTDTVVATPEKVGEVFTTVDTTVALVATPVVVPAVVDVPTHMLSAKDTALLASLDLAPAAPVTNLFSSVNAEVKPEVDTPTSEPVKSLFGA